MNKIITNTEPICAIGNTQGCKNPHYVAVLESLNPETRVARLRCATDPSQGFFGTLSEEITIPDGSYILLQEKVSPGTQILKVKDFGSEENWRTGESYTPVIEDSIQFSSYRQKSMPVVVAG